MAITNWHALSSEEVLHHLNATKKGLTQSEVHRRIQIYGANRLKAAKKRSAWLRFLDQFNNVLIYILLISAGITIFLREWVDATVILGVVILNAIIGFIQEGKAEKALDAIRNLLSLQAVVVRDGRRQTVLAENLVPGDIVFLSPGDKVPADLRLLNTKNLQIQEAILTGESNPVEKTSESVAETTSNLGDRVSMTYSGTLVTYGRGVGVVVATGEKTEIGRISEMITEATSLETPLLKQMNVLGRWISLIICLMALTTFLIGFFVWGNSFDDMFMAAVSLAVAAIPEGLPAIITITLAIGITRMAKRNAIIRKLPAVEIMGSVSVICTDKTGTLTRNELAAQKVITAKHNYNVTGSGYNSSGEIKIDEKAIIPDEHKELMSIAKATVLCNDAELTRVGDEWILQGSPVDGALLTFGLKAGIDLHALRQSYATTDFIPFESANKFMGTLNHDDQGNGFIYIKGAPEKILSMCQFQSTDGHKEPLQLEYWRKHIRELASQGQRLIAIAYKPAAIEQKILNFTDLDQDMILLGLFGLLDLPREEAVAAVSQTQHAGIKIKMITGDHILTARAIAKMVGIKSCDRVLTGKDLDEIDDEVLHGVVKDVDVYARTSPEHKLRLVKALQSRNHIVAMTGDGVNDAPALKQANIGVAMGKRGTEAAKEVSEMVLVDDNFASIAHAVEEGRTVYDNLKKTLIYILPNDIAEAAILVMAILLGKMLPITAVQILWVNLITAVTLALALAFESAEDGVMQRRPRPPNQPLITLFLLWRILFVSALIVICGFGLFLLERKLQTDIMQARTVVVNMIVMAECVYLFNCRKIREATWNWNGLFGSKPVLIAVGLTIIFQLLFTYIPYMERFFGVASIGFKQWGLILVASGCIYLLVELEKCIVRKFRIAK
ncbi:MAG: cation-transporting P-type ATPase [Gammaproteobacteria bacterium]|jgi:magnesium-transporting ATPase (P-type)